MEAEVPMVYRVPRYLPIWLAARDATERNVPTVGGTVFLYGFEMGVKMFTVPAKNIRILIAFSN